MNKDKLKKVASELENASKMHANQAKTVRSMLKMKKSGPFKMKSPLKKQGPCWDGYEMYGTKMKDGKKVPNCIRPPKK